MDHVKIIENLKIRLFDGDQLHIKDDEPLHLLRARTVGRKGILTEAFSLLRSVPPEHKMTFGRALNEIRNQVENELERLKQKSELFNLECLNNHKITLRPHPYIKPGRPNLLQETIANLSEFLDNHGFTHIEGPHLETTDTNFDLLNTSPNHPSRAIQDTFYFDDQTVLRTHTTGSLANRVRHLKPPFKAYVIGQVYRNDEEDATHATMFHQLDLLVMEREGLSLAHLKGLIDTVLYCVFGKQQKWQFVPSFFPFTEPSGEAYVNEVEILGAGLLHRNVLKNMGFANHGCLALGMGIDRVCALLDQEAGVNIRDLYTVEPRRYL